MTFEFSDCIIVTRHIDNYQYEGDLMNLNDAAAICKAMADPNRLQIIRLLCEKDRCANELLGELDISQSTLSHHMKILCESGMVRSEKEGKHTGYYLCCRTIHIYNEFVSDFECSSYGTDRCHCTGSVCGADKCVVCSED